MTWDEIKQIWTRLLCMVRLCQQFEDHKTEDGEGLRCKNCRRWIVFHSHEP